MSVCVYMYIYFIPNLIVMNGLIINSWLIELSVFLIKRFSVISYGIILDNVRGTNRYVFFDVLIIFVAKKKIIFFCQFLLNSTE